MERSAISVTQLNQYLKNILEADYNLRNILVCGEISNLTIHGSGHIYLKLKDEGGIVSAVMFRSSAAKLKFRPENGMKVIVRGNISVFEKTGVYQIYITEMKQDGIGDLYVALEQLKKQLAAAGIFDGSHKLKIPAMPKRIGVITSPSGAAVRDIIDITGRRYPLAELLIYPAIVQGDSAHQSLINGLRYFEEKQNVDVIIIGRGGGSIEDLWGFNSAELAIELYNCTIPTISAVGHETDFTICDFAADLRAPTPSAAAELAVPDIADLIEQIHQNKNRLNVALSGKLRQCRSLYERYALAKILRDPKAFTDKPYMMLDHLVSKLKHNANNACSQQKMKLSTYMAKLDALSPLKVLNRGFAMASDGQGHLIKSVSSVEVDSSLVLRMADGSLRCTVNEIEKEDNYGKGNEI